MRWVPVVTALTLAVGSAAGGAVLAAPPLQQDPSINGTTEQTQEAPPTLDIRSAAAVPQDGGFGPNATTVAVEPIISQPTEAQLAQVEQGSIAAAPQQSAGFDQVTDADADGDRIPDQIDNCPWNGNTGQEDWDGDGVGDACAQAAAAPQPEPDADGDGIPDLRDNCWLIHNPNQTDGDGDGLGNGCDEGSTPSHYSAEQPVSAERTVVEATLSVAGQPVDGVVEAAPEPVPVDEGGRNRDETRQDVDPAPVEEPPADDGGRDRDRRGDADRVEVVEPEPARLDRGLDPVERGDRPRRNPDLTEESGPVLPPPANTRRMDAPTAAGWEPLARIDAGQIGAIPRVDVRDVGAGPGPRRHAPDRAGEAIDAGDGVPPAAAPEPTGTPVTTETSSSGALPVPVDQDGAPPTGGQPPALEDAVGLRPGTTLGWQAAPEDGAAGSPSSRQAEGGGVVLIDSAPDPGDVALPTATAGPGDGPSAAAPTATPVVSDPGDGPADAQAAPDAVATATAAPSRLESGQGGGRKRDRAGKRGAREQAAAEPWASDDGYRGGEATISATGDIAGTDEDELYRTQRTTGSRDIDNRFVYAIEVPEDGVYRVRLHFAETYWGVEGGGKGKKGARVFDVDAEGEPALQRFDINAEVGPMTAVVKMFDVEVDDGTLELEFRGVTDRPAVAAIEVLQPVDKLPPVDADRARRAKAALDEIP